MIPLTDIDFHDAINQDVHDSCYVVLGPSCAVASDLATTPGLREAALVRTLPGPAAFVDETAVFIHTGIWYVNPRSLVLPHCAPLPGKSTRWATDRRILRDTDLVGATTTIERTIADLLFLRDPARSVPPIMALLSLGAHVDRVHDILGQRFRSYPTDDLKELIDQLAGQSSDYSNQLGGRRRTRPQYHAMHEARD